MQLYLHIPFCAQICRYCDFTAWTAPERVQAEFVELVLAELRLRLQKMDAATLRFETVYLGGGSPSALSAPLLGALLGGLEPYTAGTQEFTMEWNPVEVSPSKIQIALGQGVGRYSLGIQSLDGATLKRIGRAHSAELALESWQMLAQNFKTGNVDLMFALPGQTESEFLRGMETVLALAPRHVSFYGLTLEGNSVLAQSARRGGWQVDEGLYATEYLRGAELLEAAGVLRYEVSNFALAGHESLHNLGYWKGAEYLGVGPGAHSFWGGVRSAAPNRYPLWRDWVRAGCPESGLEADRPDAAGQELERLWLALRTREGAPLQEFTLSPKALEKYLRKNWLFIENGHVRLAGEGWLFMDGVCVDLLS